MLKVSGVFVAPGEIENCLLQHEAVFECAVIGHDAGDGLVKPKAFIVLREGYDADAEREEEIKASSNQDLRCTSIHAGLSLLLRCRRTTAEKLIRKSPKRALSESVKIRRHASPSLRLSLITYHWSRMHALLYTNQNPIW